MTCIDLVGLGRLSSAAIRIACSRVTGLRLNVYSRTPERFHGRDLPPSIVAHPLSALAPAVHPLVICTSVDETPLVASYRQRHPQRPVPRAIVASENLAHLRTHVPDEVLRGRMVFVVSNPVELLLLDLVARAGHSAVYGFGVDVDDERLVHAAASLPIRCSKSVGLHMFGPVVAVSRRGERTLSAVLEEGLHREFSGSVPPVAIPARHLARLLVALHGGGVIGVSVSPDGTAGGVGVADLLLPRGRLRHRSVPMGARKALLRARRRLARLHAQGSYGG